MEIIWLGHSCFRLRAEESVVITDPFPNSIGLKPDPRPATAVTISNTHPNHNNWEEVTGEPQIFKSPGEYEYSGVAVRGVMTPLALGSYDLTTRNTAFSIQLDGVSICHLGDISEPLTSNEIDQLSPVDILLVPIGGGCTLDIERIHQTVQDLDPKVMIPMHYNIPNVNVPLGDLDVFLRLTGTSDVEPLARVIFTTSNLPPNLQVSVLAPQGRPA